MWYYVCWNVSFPQRTLCTHSINCKSGCTFILIACHLCGKTCQVQSKKMSVDEILNHTQPWHSFDTVRHSSGTRGQMFRKYLLAHQHSRFTLQTCPTRRLSYFWSSFCWPPPRAMHVTENGAKNYIKSEMLPGLVAELTGLGKKTPKNLKKFFFIIFLLSVIQKWWNVGSRNALYLKRNWQRFDHVIKKCIMQPMLKSSAFLMVKCKQKIF